MEFSQYNVRLFDFYSYICNYIVDTSSLLDSLRYSCIFKELNLHPCVAMMRGCFLLKPVPTQLGVGADLSRRPSKGDLGGSNQNQSNYEAVSYKNVGVQGHSRMVCRILHPRSRQQQPHAVAPCVHGRDAPHPLTYLGRGISALSKCTS